MKKFYISDSQLVTTDMLSGNGINLLDGTEHFDGFNIINKNGMIEENAELSKNIIHLWQQNGNLYSGINKDNIQITLPRGTYTFSFLGKTNWPDGSAPLSLFLNSEDKPLGSTTLSSKTFKIYSISFYLNQSQSLTGITLKNTQGYKFPGGSLYLCDFKLEAGYGATPWCKSINDIVSQIPSGGGKTPL